MQRTLLCASLAIVLALPVTAANPTVASKDIEQVLTMRVDGTIAVDETGKVLTSTLDTPVDPRFRDVIERAIATWKFDPPTVDGKPARVKSAMRVTLVGREVAAGTEVTIDNVLFFAPGQQNANWADEAKKLGKLSMAVVEMPRKPLYPKGFHVNGIVTMAVRANADGTVADVFPTQCSLYQAGGRPDDFARACKQMQDLAAKAIKTWKIGITLNGDVPTDDNLTATVPLEYKMWGDGKRIGKTGEPGNWRMEARTQYVEAPWLVEKRLAQRVGTSDVSGSELLQPHSPLKLRDGARS
ncbi:TonB family protein [Lysobacter dokdonensis DS-58]|uniref:TonB family protein n=1 Tax=Lysobacter dokdonensis DS-58 TaxID=1300345 RepID=A0A0A2WFE0_9GAMM|nr:hypothetical protein [Lysobacter dokdonensis]KGQ18916.1 TonB family protein [Lysobacter dokdonensis DS-58]